jgi:hypothetical protein
MGRHGSITGLSDSSVMRTSRPLHQPARPAVTQVNGAKDGGRNFVMARVLPDAIEKGVAEEAAS